MGGACEETDATKHPDWPLHRLVLTTVFTGFIESVGSLYATRLILGACEAGSYRA